MNDGQEERRLIVERPRQHVAAITINRPHRHNAFDWETWSELGGHFNTLSSDDDVRCIVLRASGGKAFSTGADISEFPTLRRTRAQALAYGTLVKSCWDALLACPQPVISVINGLCVGGGLELACLSDIRIASDDSRFGMPLKRLGAVLAYPELKPILRVVGPANTLELLLEGQILGVADAKRMGIVSRVYPKAEIEAAGIDVAESIAQGAPLSARWHKQFVRKLTPDPELSEADLLEAFECFDTEDFNAGFNAFLAKQEPGFKGR